MPPSLNIANIENNTVTCIEHNLNIEDYIRIENTAWQSVIIQV